MYKGDDDDDDDDDDDNNNNNNLVWVRSKTVKFCFKNLSQKLFQNLGYNRGNI